MVNEYQGKRTVTFHPSIGSVVACALLAVLVLAAPTHAQADKRELQQRFKDRYPRLLKAQDAGKVGETWTGLVGEVRKGDADDDLRRLIDNENSDRRALYRLLAKEQDTTEEKVAERARLRKYERAAPAHFVQSRSLEWVRKRDLKDGGGGEG